MALDPYGFDPSAPPMWDGPWPPDPSWDAPPVETPVPEDALALPVPPPAPEPVDPYAPPPAAAGDLPVQLGFPTNPDAPAPGAPQLDAINPDLIEMDAGPADWSGLEQGQPADPYADGVDPGQPWDAGLIEQDAPEAPPFEPTEEERIAGLAAADPVAFADAQAKHQMAAENEAATRRLALSDQDRQQAEGNERVRREAMARTEAKLAATDAEAERLANERVDPDGWRDSRSLFQTIAMFTAGIVGGLVQSRSGGPNQGLAMINDAIEKHIAAQQANLAHRRDMLGRTREGIVDAGARAEQEFRSVEAFRQAAWQRAASDLDTEMQQFDPKGTRWLKLAGVRRDVQAQQMAARQAAVEQTLDREIKVGTYDLAVATHNETVRKNQAAEQLAARKAAGSGSGGSSAAKVKYDPATLASKFGLDPAKVAGMPPMTVGEFNTVMEAAKKGQSLNEPTEAAKQVTQGAVYGPQGKMEWEGGVPAGDPEAMRKAVIYAGIKAKLIDEVLAIRDRVGGESAWGNSDDFQRLDVLQQQLVLAAKAPTEGLSSDKDMEKVAASIGARDVSSFRSQAAALKQGRKLTVEEVNAVVVGHGYKGPPLEYAKLYKPAKKTAEQYKDDAIIHSETGAEGQFFPTLAMAAGPSFIMARGIESAVRSENTNLPEGDEKAQIDGLIADAIGGDPAKRKTASVRLGNYADKSKSPAIRAYARQALRNVRTDAYRTAGALSPLLSALADETAPEEED